jgi:Spy/CpxP family protein refolding chaperone
MRRIPTITAVLVAGGLLVAAPLRAQDPQHPPMMEVPGMMQMEGMMLGPHAAPQMILRMRGPLELTEQQVQRIEAIQREMHHAHHSHMEAAMQMMKEAQGLLNTDRPDWGRYEAQLRSAVERHVQAHVVMARASVDARGELTGEQLARLDTGMAMMREMMTERMGGMMDGMGQGMMQHDQHQPVPSTRPH